jgi:hypothetical protein
LTLIPTLIYTFIDFGQYHIFLAQGSSGTKAVRTLAIQALKTLQLTSHLRVMLACSISHRQLGIETGEHGGK